MKRLLLLAAGLLPYGAHPPIGRGAPKKAHAPPGACHAQRFRVAYAKHTVNSPDSDQTRWFVEEVQSHERALRAHLRGAFPAVRDVDDLVQESYLRVWRARTAQPIRLAKAFLFKVARHLALDLVRRDRISPIELVGDLSALLVIEDRPDVAETVSNRERIRLLAEAIDSLPARCRAIVILRKLKCISQKEVATQLGLSEKTVEAQLIRGVKRCEEFLRARGMRNLYGE